MPLREDNTRDTDTCTDFGGAPTQTGGAATTHDTTGGKVTSPGNNNRPMEVHFGDPRRGCIGKPPNL
jgi:hypothetical protein